MKYPSDKKLKLSLSALAFRGAIEELPQYAMLRAFVSGQILLEKIGGQDDKPDNIVRELLVATFLLPTYLQHGRATTTTLGC